MTTSATKTKSDLVTRPPIVVVLGHIDHGKTTLLDTIRKTEVAAGESGGITQHTGAYHIKHKDRVVAFIDTPGHEAFTKMRSRGTQVADVAILVVAADDGVKPQTIEAIKIIRQAKIPFVVAINKIDKGEANLQRVKQQLAEADVQVEDWGGKIPVQEISAKTGKGIDELLDLVLLVADLEDLKAKPNENASGIVIESHTGSKRGVVATLIIKSGRMRTGDYIAAENVSGKIKALEDADGHALKEANFLAPAVLVAGFEGLPALGAEFRVFENKKELEEYVSKHSEANKKVQRQKSQEGETIKTLKIVLKADTQGTLEAIEKTLVEISTQEVRLEILDAKIGDVSEADIKLASSANAPIFAFKVRVSSEMQNLADQFSVGIFVFEVIYDLVEEVKKTMVALLEPKAQKENTGRLKVLATFKETPRGQIIGGKVTSGFIKRGEKAVITRNKNEVGLGSIAQLQQNKIEADQIKEGMECGLLFTAENSNVKVEVGDILEAFEERFEKPSL
ncbi:translation initiation factor IF-2 [Candidatus Parcubacteria bacterium]|nr:MAG: translation initiation factor IF-2 [Candidatus Parcubacteria bacterium]